MTILVLEETEADLPHHQRILETIPGVRVALLADAAVAQRTFVEQRIDLVVIDDGIRDGGLAFLRTIHLLSGRRDAPVILIAANGDKDARRAAYEYGVYNVIEKPIDPPSYLCIARNALSMAVMRRNDATSSGLIAEQYKALQEKLDEREVQVIYSLLHAANLNDAALSRRMARVAGFAQRIAHRSMLSHEDARRCGVAARVYDIGMLAIAPALRERRTELAPEDAPRLLGAHAQRAYEIFGKERSPLIDLAATIARSHHERFDGRGYPDGLQGHDISIFAQIVGMAEAFTDAVTSGVGARATPLSEMQALQYIDRQTGTTYAPEIVDALRMVVTAPLGEAAATA